MRPRRSPTSSTAAGSTTSWNRSPQFPDAAITLLVVGHAPGIPATAAELVTIAALARADPASSEADDPAAAADPEPAPDGLRHFSAGALAVLTTGGSWAELADHGADLTAVRHPGR